MDIQALHCGLIRHQALIIHFSHRANMRENGVFPADLHAAIANKDCWALSCCVVWPNHTMDLPGDVGIILRPTSCDQILSVSKTDSGSFQSDCGTDLSGGEPLTPESLEETFNVAPNDYNEWRVRGAEVVGIFVVSPREVSAKILQPVMLDGVKFCDTIAPAVFTIDQVRSAFPSQRICTMTENGPCEIT